MFRWKHNQNYCLQAGETVLEDGSKMRLYGCDPNVLLQQFQWTGGQDRTNARIIPLSNTTLCVTHRGINANINIDPIILRTCAALTDTRLVWTHGA